MRRHEVLHDESRVPRRRISLRADDFANGVLNFRLAQARREVASRMATSSASPLARSLRPPFVYCSIDSRRCLTARRRTASDLLVREIAARVNPLVLERREEKTQRRDASLLAGLERLLQVALDAAAHTREATTAVAFRPWIASSSARPGTSITARRRSCARSPGSTRIAFPKRNGAASRSTWASRTRSGKACGSPSSTCRGTSGSCGTCSRERVGSTRSSSSSPRTSRSCRRRASTSRSSGCSASGEALWR